jgi:predicted ester cyclase
MEENKVMIKSFIDEVFNQHDLTAIERYHSPYLTNDSGKTVELFKKYLTALFSGFPDLHVNIEHILAENDFVLVFLIFVGTHKGEFNRRPPTLSQ